MMNDEHAETTDGEAQPDEQSIEQPAGGDLVDAAEKTGSSSTGRIILWGALVIFAIPAVIEIVAQRGARQTGDAWRTIYREVDPLSGDMRESHLAEHVVGNPTVEEVLIADLAEDDDRQPEGVTAKITTAVRTYTWKGVIRTFTVDVYFGIGEDRVVEDIKGPQEPPVSQNVEWVDEPPPDELEEESDAPDIEQPTPTEAATDQPEGSTE